MHFLGSWFVKKFVSFLHETKKIKLHYFLWKPFCDFKTWQPYPTFVRSLPVRILPDSSSRKRSLCWNFSRVPTVCESRKIHQNSVSFHNLYHFNGAAYYLTVWFGTLQKIPFSSFFTVVWLNKSHTLCISLARSIAATAKLGSLAIKMWDCEFMTGNQFPESEAMRPVVGSLNLQVNPKIHRNDVNF